MTRIMVGLARGALVLGLSATFGCPGVISPPSAIVTPPDPDPDPKPDPDPMPRPDPIVRVPADLPTLTATATCAALEPNERVVAVSPEGHLWLAATSTVQDAAIRVLDGWSIATERRYTVPVARIQSVGAWTATTASLIADGRLYALDDGDRTVVSFPEPLADDATLCGNPTARAFVHTAGALYERVDDEWWSWTGFEDALSAGATLVTRDGECAGADDGVWLATKSLELWRLSASTFTRPVAIEAGRDPALLGDRVLVLADGGLLVGPDRWAEYAFDLGAADALAAAGSYAWIRIGDALLRFDGTTFWKTNAAVDGALHPHASGGVWVEGAQSVCHVTPGPMLRVDGLRNGEQRLEDRFVLKVRATDADMDVTLTLDGAPIAADGVDDGWFRFSGSLDVGWHALALEAEETTRTLAVKRLPSVIRSFDADVRPIFETHCMGCHADGANPAAPTIDSYDEWAARADKIRQRVVVAQDMPPAASRSPMWGEDEIEMINEWLGGGVRP